MLNKIDFINAMNSPERVDKISAGLSKFYNEHPNFNKNLTIKSYENLFKKLELIKPYSYEETFNKLIKNDYWKSLKGKSKNRTLIKEDIKLYKSIQYYSQDLESQVLSSYYNYNFYAKVIYIAKYNRDLSKITKNKYKAHFYNKKDQFLVSIKHASYSNISQELFWEIYYRLEDKENINFGELNKEFYIKKKIKTGKRFSGYYVDFKQNNKIIEFDSDYWHKDKIEQDIIRDEYLKSLGYEILRINMKEYQHNKQQTIKKCLYFLNFIPNKLELQVLTPQGFKHFDGIKVANTLLYKVEFLNGEVLECTEDHIIQTTLGDKSLNQIHEKDVIIYNNEFTQIQNIQLLTLDEEKVYDLINVKDTNKYFTNGIISHNSCDFIMSGESALEPEHIKYIKEEFVKEPIAMEGSNKEFWIWQYAREGVEYIISADTGKGDGSDYSTAQVIRVDNFEQVAEFQGKLPADRFGQLLCKWGHDYNTALLIPENNATSGGMTVQKIIDANYPKLFWFDKRFKGLVFPELNEQGMGKQEPGWITTTKTRPIILENLLKLLRELAMTQGRGGITVHSLRLASELNSWGYHGPNGRLDHLKNKNDDLILALAIGAFVKTVYNKLTFNAAKDSLEFMKIWSNEKTKADMTFGVSNPRHRIQGSYEHEGEDISWLTRD